jgi:trehalose 6-phosphate phosphatase
MRYFLEGEFIQSLEGKIKKTQKIFLFLDYDGTLTPIRKKPEQALLSSSVGKTLKSLSSFPQIELTIVSGRALNEIHKLINLDSLNYVGNHGLEIKTKSFQDEILHAEKIRKNIASFCQRIKRSTKEYSGILVENKGLTASIHYRLAKSEIRPELRKIISSIIFPFRPEYELRDGKKILEIRPKSRRDKGWAVDKIIRLYGSKRNPSSLYFYFGDDLTDEDAFEITNLRRGFSVLVGKGGGSSKARYYLENSKEVHTFLTCLNQELKP